jgi:tetratricopeptide (TPR) repeat protein
MLKQDFEKSLLDELFEASYDPTLTSVSENEAREKLKARLNELTSSIDRKLPSDRLVRNLSLMLLGYMECKEYALFGIDFALERKGNCVVYASVIVSALEYMGRKDVIEKLRVKYTPDHIWLVYKDDSSHFEIYVNGRKSDEEHDIKALIAANWNWKGFILGELGRYEEALKCFDEALEINYKDSNIWNNKGVILYKLGKYKKALKCFDEALKISPKDSIFWNNKGLALYQLGRYEEAIICYDEALEINTKDGNVWNNKGLALYQLGRYEEALKCFDEALEINTKDGNVWNNKGAALYQLGRYEEALKCFDEALKISPKDYNALKNKIITLSKLGRYEEAYECLNEDRC